MCNFAFRKSLTQVDIIIASWKSIVANILLEFKPLKISSRMVMSMWIRQTWYIN